MAEGQTDPLVGTDWLADHMSDPDLRIVDATWFLPTVGRDARVEHARCHIPGAVFFDIEDIASEASPYPHMIPSPVKFSARMRRLGLGDGSRILVYDNNKFIASARAWWMLRLFGHEDTVVLDGGLGKWMAEHGPVTDEPSRPTERHFTARQNNLLLREIDQLRTNLTQKAEQVVDARARGRFSGAEPEPRPGLRSGHIPGSRNLPYTELVAPDGTMRPPRELEATLAAAGVDLARPVVTTCGSGVSAAVINLALYRLGLPDTALYDGSWAEWGALSDTPVAR